MPSQRVRSLDIAFDHLCILTGDTPRDAHDFVSLFVSRLYKTCQWEDKVLRRLIGDGKLASRKTTTSTTTPTSTAAGGAPSSLASITAASSWECPICFCNYDEINRTICCEKEICTECYLQLKPPQKNINVPCPFCVGQKLKVERCLETPPKSATTTAVNNTTTNTTTGAEEEKDSAGDRPHQHNSGTTAPSSPLPSSLEQPRPTAYCLTPEQRQKLEAKVAEQQIHPLAARLAQEEAERRLANELHYLTSNPNMMQSLQQHQQQQSSASSFRQQHYPPPARTMQLTEEQQLAMAIEASLRTGA
jgi:hypothetical protein